MLARSIAIRGSVDPHAECADTSEMSSVAEIEAAIERLSPPEVNQVAVWLEQRRQELLRSSVSVPTKGAPPKTRGGVPLLPSRGEIVTPEKVHRLMEQEGV